MIAEYLLPDRENINEQEVEFRQYYKESQEDEENG